jgi:4-cresol dehydrogenase (hydroxylating)
MAADRWVAPDTLAAALERFGAVVGKDWVLSSDADRAHYQDVYAIGATTDYAAGAAVAPASVEEVQALVRIANETGVPLWPISRGKNFGYGGAAPVLGGSVVVDLTRMNRIIDVDEKRACCVLEPGVGFYDLHRHLRDNGIALWLSSPGNSLGSVIGNALEHGTGITPYGDHALNLCGLEVVMPDGALVRTGMGAMPDNPTWHTARHGFGPDWDLMFTQSNFGIVTRAGMWLMPEPEATLGMSMELPNAGDIAWLVDTLGRLRTAGIIRQSTTIRNFMRAAAMSSQRQEWYDGEGALPDAVIEQILRKLEVGWWNVNLRLYGLPEANEAHARYIADAFARHTDRRFEIARWRKGEPPALSGESVPTTASLQMVNWAGARGAHVGFSPVLPLDGRLVHEQFERTRLRMREFGFDYYGSMYLFERSITVISQLFYDRDDPAMIERLRALFKALVEDAAAHGYAEYRTHIEFMDEVAQSFAWNDHALLRLNEKLKDALDPNGIIAPGKQGIWPRRFREA